MHVPYRFVRGRDNSGALERSKDFGSSGSMDLISSTGFNNGGKVKGGGGRRSGERERVERQLTGFSSPHSPLPFPLSGPPTARNSTASALSCQSNDDLGNGHQYGNRQFSESFIENWKMANGTTIEDQMRVVDKIIKECDMSRKSLDQISRRLDDLQDEVKRYRDFLSHEKSRRDPALYKTTNNCDRPSIYNDHICSTMGNLTAQLSQEWTEKLRSIHEIIHKVSSSSPPNSTMASRASGQM